MIKVLLIGNCNHYFNRKLVGVLHDNYSNLIIDFFSIQEPNNDLELPYNHIIDYSISRNTVNYILRTPGIFTLFCFLRWNLSLKRTIKHGEYDYIHLQGLEIWQIGIQKLHKKIILTVWGSDFLRLSNFKLSIIGTFIKQLHAITFATKEISNKFNGIFKTKEKHIIIKFGLAVFDEIDLIREKHIPEKSKTNIVVGYNRHPAQQHLKILNEIQRLSSEIKERINIILPWTYGPVDINYLNEIKTVLDNSNIEYKLLETFMSESEMAKLCLESDIMIQLQKTDAFSGSMQEFMYAGNLIITGEWLNYAELRDNDVFFYEINDFSQINVLLANIIKNIKLEKLKVQNNSSELYKLSSWEGNIKKWHNLYKS